jgi:tetratricopeptide (TPR) repeat protein
MSRDTDNSLFIVFSMPRFYQQLLSGIASYEELGNRVIRRIKAAHAFRRVEQVRELSTLLLNIPIKEYQLIAQYYLVWCKCRDYEYPAATLEKIIEQTRTYKTKALFSRAAIEGFHGDIPTAIYFYNEALKTSPTISEYVDLVRSIAVLKSAEGFHKSAMRDLENLIPLIKHVEPRLYYDFLNSLAVELGISGRKDEARNISKLVLASPFAYAYPEWQETANDLKGINRSFVVIDPSPYIPPNVLPMPAFERDNAEPPSWAGQPAQVVNYEQWIKKMAKRKKNGDKKKPYDQMDEREMFFEIMNIYSSGDTTDEQRRRIFKAVIGAMSEPIKPEPDPDEPKPDEPEGA